MSDWLIYRGSGEPHGGLREKLPEPPPWRTFNRSGDDATRRLGELARAVSYRPDDEEIELVNAALYLRRPLLVTGKPGTGKSTLAHSVARELGLGRVLSWPITSKSDRLEGLYQYDAIARLQDASLRQSEGRDAADLDIGRYIRLGPLGTALLPQHLPRVLLIDELDKSDIDLPNDLLTLFEEGKYEIRELSRIAADQPTANVQTHDGESTVEIRDGKVCCEAFPLIIITSNGERDFPPPFLRRCLRLQLKPPSKDRLNDIVRAHLGRNAAETAADLLDRFVSLRNNGDLATDQLLNAIYLASRHAWPGDREKLVSEVMQYLNTSEQQ